MGSILSILQILSYRFGVAETESHLQHIRWHISCHLVQGRKHAFFEGRQTITAWYENCSEAGRNVLQTVIGSAQKWPTASSPEGICTSVCRNQFKNSMTDPTLPTHELFTPIPPGQKVVQPQSPDNKADGQLLTWGWDTWTQSLC